MDDKVDAIHKLLLQLNTTDLSSAKKSLPQTSPSTTPPPSASDPLLTSEDIAFLKKQEAAGKISLHHESFFHTGKTQP
jgi:hypothetical protein